MECLRFLFEHARQFQNAPYWPTDSYNYLGTRAGKGCNCRWRRLNLDEKTDQKDEGKNGEKV